MKTKIYLLTFIFLLISYPYSQNTDWSSVDKVFGKKGSLNGAVYKITFPRTDLNVTFDGKKIETALAFTSWIAFLNTPSGTMIMGDLVLQDKEVPAVEQKLINNGIQITGIHNHILGETPVVKYMHFSGMGDAVQLATGMKDALSASSTPLVSTSTSTPGNDIDWSKIEEILGYKGTKNGSIIQFGIPRKTAITEMGVEIPPYMGMATTINIQDAGDDKVFATGDFVLIGDEVSAVMNELIQNGITVTALHNHMIDETPRIFFMHYWGYDDAEKVASGLKKALGKGNFAESNK